MERIFKQIAKNNGVTLNEVKKEMQKAIEAAMQSEEPKDQAFWESLSPNGKTPKVEDVIKQIVKDLNL